jgi:hypothetical protein
MRKKIIGIFVIMLMIATLVPVTGTIQKSEQINNVVNQNNNPEALRLRKHLYGYIGFVTNKSSHGKYGIYYDAVFLLAIVPTDYSPVSFALYHSHERIHVYKRIFNFCGEHFIFDMIRD